MPQQERRNSEGLVFRTTNDIIKAAKENRLPNQIMITAHPQRWTNNPLQWTKELIIQNAKNMVKRFVILRKEYFTTDYTEKKRVHHRLHR